MSKNFLHRWHHTRWRRQGNQCRHGRIPCGRALFDWQLPNWRIFEVYLGGLGLLWVCLIVGSNQHAIAWKWGHGTLLTQGNFRGELSIALFQRWRHSRRRRGCRLTGGIWSCLGVGALVGILLGDEVGKWTRRGWMTWCRRLLPERILDGRLA